MGAAYLYERIDGAWTFITRVQPSDIGQGDDFGGKMSLHGTRAVINSRYHGSNEGAVYVYDKVGDVWDEIAKLESSDLQTGDNFGQSSSVYGDRIVVGARREDTGGNDAGAAYVFELINGVWTETTKLQSSDIQAEDRFGNSVSVWEDRIAVGGGGGIYIFELENGIWVEKTKILPLTSEKIFGQDVDLEGDRVASASTNKAFVFDFDGASWNQTAILTATSDEDAETFGRRVSLSGDRVISGAQNAGSGDLLSAGAAFVFELQNGTWTQIAELRASDREGQDRFGSAVDITGGNVISGAPGEAFTDTDMTAAYIYEFSSDPSAVFTFAEDDLTLDFDGSGSTDDGTISSWDWDFGDGNTGSGEFVTHTFAAIGTYDVTLTVTDELGATDSITETIDVGNPLPVPLFVATPVAGTLDVDFDAAASTDDGSIVTWDWDFDDGNTGIGEIVSHTYLATGTYSVTLTVTDDEGASDSIIQDVEIVNEDPVAAFTPTQVAGTLDVDFDAASSSDDGSITAWDWDFGDGNTGAGETASHTYATAGTYSVSLTVTDNLGATNTITQDVDVVNEDPIAVFSANPVAGTLDVDFDATSSSDDGSLAAWDWDFGDGNTGSGETATHSYDAVGTYSVSLTVTDNLGATNTTTQDVDVVNEDPVAAFSALQVTGTLDVDFDAASSTDDGSITAWDWDFGDGNSGSGETVSHTYAAAGTYSVSLTVTDNLGATNTVTVDTDVINDAPVAAFTTVQTAGTLDVDFDGSTSTDDGSITAWDWDFGDSNTASGETVSHSYAAAGTYSVMLTVTDNLGATGSVTVDIDVVENQDPVASFTATQVSGTLDVDFDGAGSTDDGTITDWDWDFGDGNTGTGETAVHTYAAPGTFTVSLTVTDDAGASNTVTSDVEVVDPNAPPTAAFSATQVAGTLEVNFDGSTSSDDGSIAAWDWDFGDGNTGAGETISHTYATAGTYSVTLTVTDDLGATGSLTTDVEVTNGDPVAAFTSTQTAGTLDVDFDGSASTDDGSITAWDWDFGDGNSSAGETVSHTYGASGTYTVVLTVTDNVGATGSTSVDVEVTENQLPVASFTATQVAGTFDADFDGSASSDDGSITDWDWDFGDGNTGAGETITHAFAAAGTYTVVLTVTDNTGQTGTLSQDVEITEPSDDGPFVETAGLVVVEAENYHERIDRSDHSWIENTDLDGFTGSAAMFADPDNGTQISTGNETTAPELAYDIDFSTTGDYFIWARVWADDGGDNSVHLGVDGAIDALSRGARWNVTDAWVWQELTRNTSSITYNIDAAGVHTLNLYMLEDGAYVDKILMTTDGGFVPTGDGPDESPRGAAVTAKAGGSFDRLQFGNAGQAAVEIPEEFALKGNYPNPFNPSTVIAFDLPEDAHVSLEVYDMMGRRVATLVNGQMAAGKYEATWHARSDAGTAVASGVYLYRMQAGSFESVQRMVLMK
ncbi:MAG: PKD domain-containing protein [Bacteroidota bacterium]